jgi:hypothetical protein
MKIDEEELIRKTIRYLAQASVAAGRYSNGRNREKNAERFRQSIPTNCKEIVGKMERKNMDTKELGEGIIRLIRISLPGII